MEGISKGSLPRSKNYIDCMKLTTQQRNDLIDLLVHSLLGEINDQVTRLEVRRKVNLFLEKNGVDDFWITISDDPEIIDRHGFEMCIWFPDQNDNVQITMYPEREPLPSNRRAQDIHIRMNFWR